ncbi:MAG: glycosyltransferase family 4 protein [Sedimentisphaerales bacterium]|nr:glycosyltransferase family 4 protein [Sedimentisphaerales bacterium]
MNIVHITPSAGDSFYCENCLRDAALIKAMMKTGHDVLSVPLYLPLSADASDSIVKSQIFFGGINVYLQQKSSFFQKTPRWLDRIFDSPGLLRWIGRKAGMTSAKELGETTTSMLLGEQGKQIKELDRLVDWLSAQDSKPDVVCLSNIMLVGLARSIKQKLGVPLFCLLQDEDGFLDGLPSPYSQQAWNIITERASDIEAFIAVSKYYSDVMQQRLEIAPERIHVVYMGISLDGYELRQAGPEVPTIGFLSRACSDKGLDTLIDAFIYLKKNEKIKDTKLRITGGKMSDDEKFLNRIRQQLNSCGLIDDVEFVSDFDRISKSDFLRTLSVLSVPEKHSVAYGLYVLEALAAGVPVVEPSSGVFPELIEITNGGILFEPNDTGSLASAIEKLLIEPDYARKLAKQGREAVFEKFNIEQTAEEIVRIYGQAIESYALGKLCLSL